MIGPNELAIVSAVFLTVFVEFVEAFTIVLAVGVTRSMRSAVIGAISAVATLVVLLFALQEALGAILEYPIVHVLIGVLLLLFGLRWLRKATLRYMGVVSMHDEADIYQRELAEAARRGEVAHAGVDWPSFSSSYVGVFLEGMEAIVVVISALTLQYTITSPYMAPLVIGTAAFALILVVVIGLILRKPLTKVPENLLKFWVGLVLVGLGTIWLGEGLGVEFPFGKWVLLYVPALYTLLALIVSPIARRVLGEKSELVKDRDRQKPSPATALVPGAEK